MPTFAEMIAVKQAELEADKTLTPDQRKKTIDAYITSYYLLTGDSAFDFENILGPGKVSIGDYARGNFGDALAERPTLDNSEYGDLVRLVRDPVGKKFKQHKLDSEAYMTGMTRKNRESMWSKLVAELKQRDGKELDHFRAYDVVPQALSALALRSPVANDYAFNQHIEVASIDGRSLFSDWGDRVRFRWDWDDDSMYDDLGAGVTERYTNAT